MGDAVRFETTLTAHTPRIFEVTVHPEYDTATRSMDPAELGIYVKNPDWIQANQGWNEVMSSDRQRAIVRDAVAGGAFAYYSRAAKFGVEQQFDPQAFGTLGLFWDASRQQINLEMTSKAVSLEKGQTAGFGYEVRYLKEAPKLKKQTLPR